LRLANAVGAVGGLVFDYRVPPRVVMDHLYVNVQKNTRGNLRPMNQISVADILELPVQERIQLVEVIWESIAAYPQAIEVSPELKTELEARLADFERNPEAGHSWDQVKAHLRSGSWRTA